MVILVRNACFRVDFSSPKLTAEDVTRVRTGLLKQGVTVRQAPGLPLLSTRILGRRTAPFPPFLISNRAPRGFHPKILVLEY